jgi:hypothetical protein
MDLQPVKTSLSVSDTPWLASADGTQYAETITLDLTKFTEADHYPNGVILSGIPLIQDATSKLYGPVATDATVSEGHLYKPVVVTDTTHTHYGAALLARGVAFEDKLPWAQAAHAPGFRYRNATTGDDAE